LTAELNLRLIVWDRSEGIGDVQQFPLEIVNSRQTGLLIVMLRERSDSF
jgi:hypothetical protein